MADLLASLETGITRTVGAASRLRSHITSIDEYMSMQRQADASNSHTHVPYPVSLLPPKIEQNPNIDPTLQNEIPTTVAAEIHSLSSATYNYANEMGVSAAGGTSANAHGHEPDGQSQFQLPQELLEQWPWNIDITQGFSNFQ
jgi:hypothetical protein